MTIPSPKVQFQGQTTASADNLNTFVQIVATVTQLRSFIGLQPMSVYLQGLTDIDDGGQGMFFWQITVTVPDDGVNYIIPTGGGGGGWIRYDRDEVVSPAGVTYTCQDISTKSLSTVIARFPAGIPWTLTAGVPFGAGNVETAPDADTSFNLTKNGTLIGTADWALGSRTATFTVVSSVAFNNGDYLDLVTPPDLNSMTGAFGLTLIGTR